MCLLSQYPLYYGETPEQRVKQRGTIWIRLRLEWVDRFKAFLAAVKPPDQTVVSVARGIDFQVAHYTTEGPTDEQEFNLVTLTKYIEELQSYEILMAYISDAAMTVSLPCPQSAKKGTRVQIPQSVVTGLVMAWSLPCHCLWKGASSSTSFVDGVRLGRDCIMGFQ